MGPVPPVDVVEVSVRADADEPHRGEAGCGGTGPADGWLSGLLVLAQEADHGPAGAAEQPAGEPHIGNARTVRVVVAVVQRVGRGVEALDAEAGGEPFGADGRLQPRPLLDTGGDEGLTLYVQYRAHAERQHGLCLADPEFALHFPAPVTSIWHSRSTLRIELRVSHSPYRCSNPLSRLCWPLPWLR